MTDSEREAEVRRLARMVKECMDHAEKGDYFFWRGEADRCRLQMESLIRARSKGQVFVMEVTRGLA